MANKTIAKSDQSNSGPKFPYTTKPGSLRRLLKLIPTKPKPSRIDSTLLKSWGFADNNDATMLRVLKALGLIGSSSEPTELYQQFMRLNEGAMALAPEIRRVYAPLFNASLSPYNDGNDELRNLFNIHSGGAPKVIDLQIQTFKALAENANFDGAPVQTGAGHVTPATASNSTINMASSGGPAININLHIHLPENKTRREYENMIEDIGRYIFGRQSGSRSDQ